MKKWSASVYSRLWGRSSKPSCTRVISTSEHSSSPSSLANGLGIRTARLLPHLQNSTSIVYLLGYPGVGKYTVAREVAKLSIDDWREQLPALDVHTANPEALRDAFQGPGQGPQTNDLWPYAIACVVLLLALESLLAALFGRRRQ